MDLLTGEYWNTLDEKGRLLFPAKLRSGISDNVLIITKSLDRCLMLFTPDEWQQKATQFMQKASLTNERNRLVLRRFLASAHEVEFDKTGRISIPQSLREYAGLSKECVLLSVIKYMEIWDAESYRNYLSQNENEFSAAAEELGVITL